MRHALEIDGIWFVYVERIGAKRQRLEAATFYKSAAKPRWIIEEE